MGYLKKILEWFKLWMMVAGTLGFCLFILEEASQIATFSTFMSKQNQDYELILAAADIMDYNNKMIIALNKYIGWINPLGYIAYNSYAKAQKVYADGCIMFVLRGQPELLNDRILDLSFTPKEIVTLANNYMYRNGKIAMISDKLEPLQTMNFKGKVIDGKIHYLEKTDK